MKIPFKTHKIFVTLDDDKMYQLLQISVEKMLINPKS